MSSEPSKILGGSAARRQSVALNQMSFRKREAVANAASSGSAKGTLSSSPSSPNLSLGSRASFKNAAKKVKLGVHIASLAKNAGKEEKDSTDGTDTETPLALPRKKLKELKKMEKRRRNSMNVIIMDSFNKTFYISKSTLGRIRPLVRCADACILGLKYISSPILLPMYIAYALMNPAVKDAKVEVSENHGDSPKSDDGSRERKLAPGKMRRSQERNVIHEADEFAEEDSSNQIDLKSNTTHSVNTLKSTHTSLESHAESPSANVATPTNVGKKSPEEAYIGKNGTKSELPVAEFSKGVEKDSKHARTVVQKISGPALRDLSSSRHQGN